MFHLRPRELQAPNVEPESSLSLDALERLHHRRGRCSERAHNNRGDGGAAVRVGNVSARAQTNRLTFVSSVHERLDTANRTVHSAGYDTESHSRDQPIWIDFEADNRSPVCPGFNEHTWESFGIGSGQQERCIADDFDRAFGLHMTQISD